MPSLRGSIGACFLLVFLADADDLFERLRKEDPGVYQKVLKLDRETALRFLRERYQSDPGKRDAGGKEPQAVRPAKEPARIRTLPARAERYQKIETVELGEFSIDLCRRDDGAFGLGEVRKGRLPLRRGDFLITWNVGGKVPVFERRQGLTVFLRDPPAALELAPESRECAGIRFEGFRLEFRGGRGTIVETSSWEPGGTTLGLTYQDGYRGWHAPPGWLDAHEVPETNPKLSPSLLQGTGFQFIHGEKLSLLHFHRNPGDRLRNASRGDALEFSTSFDGPTSLARFIFTATGESRINLWTRAYEVASADLRKSFGLPEPAREVVCLWPPFGRKGFREMAAECADGTAGNGFTAAAIDVIWDNLEFHGGKKNMNVWDYSICEGYGGEAGLQALVEECRKRGIGVIAWTPAGHLNPQAPIWKEHPDWRLRNRRGEVFENPSGLWHGDLDTGFYRYFLERITGAIRSTGLGGLVLDTHLSYAQQKWDRSQNEKLAALYQSFIQAGAKHLIVEGDASVFGAYGIAIGDDWKKEWGGIPDPDLYYGSTLMGGFNDPRLHRSHFRHYVASGAAWAVTWEFLHSPKLTGEENEAARRDALEVIRDYRRVKDLMVHRFVHSGGSGYTWTNDRDARKVIWLLKDAPLPGGASGEAGRVYLIGG
jgi:hypothetical protein